MEEIQDGMEDFERRFREMLDTEEGGYVSKSDKKALLKDLQQLREDVESNLPYLLRSLQEQVEETVREAQADIDEYMDRAKEQVKGVAKKFGVEKQANKFLD